MSKRLKRRKLRQVKSDKRTPNLRPVNRNILRLREDRGLSREELAESLDVSASAVAKWEEGYSAPAIERLPDVAAALASTVDDLLAEAA